MSFIDTYSAVAVSWPLGPSRLNLWCICLNGRYFVHRAICRTPCAIVYIVRYFTRFGWSSNGRQ
jgi:hypothetical protein